MISNYVKTAKRSLLKNKGYSFLNIFGLAIGIACAALIFLWVEDELGFDQFNTKKDRLFFVRENQKYDTYTATFGSTPGLLAPAMQAEIPGVANTCRMTEGSTSLLFTIGDKAMYAGGSYTETSLFSMFTLPFVEGNAASAFKELHSIVITQKTAVKFFGTDKNVVGKSVRINNAQDYVVTGVLKDIPQNSTIQFEWLAPFQVWYDVSDWAHQWGNNCLSTYVELKPGASVDNVNKVLYKFIEEKYVKAGAPPEAVASAPRPFLFTMNDWHLRNEFDNGKQTGGGNIQYVHLFTLIAWIILLIACINFMNLATARSQQRAKEVGVRKVLGAVKNNLVFQFISETMFLALLSAVLAVIIVGLALPAFNTLVVKSLGLGLDKPLHLLSLVSITIVCGLVAGSYPSLYLSSFRPVFVLKGIKMKDGSAAIIRKGLVVVQFTVSIILIISTLIIYQQIQHVKNRSLGFNKSNLVQVDVNGEIPQHYPAIKQDILNTGAVQDVALSDHVLLYDGNNTGSLTWDGKSQGNQVLISGRYVTPGFFNTMQLKLMSGRDFVETDSSSTTMGNVVITQSLEELMGSGSALGKVLWNTGDPKNKLTIVGVVSDYLYGNMYGKPDPVLFLCTAPKHMNIMYLRLKPQSDVTASITALESVFKKNNPAYPFTYQFVDDQFNNMFFFEGLIGNLSKVFASLAILISCLGLFGLAAYTAERRTKEIGIRKVLGASIYGIASLLSKDFLKLVALSCLVAFPFAGWMMHNWLQSYQYRVDISWWIFVVAGITALLIALVTISLQSIKAAVANPIKSLRSE